MQIMFRQAECNFIQYPTTHLLIKPYSLFKKIGLLVDIISSFSVPMGETGESKLTCKWTHNNVAIRIPKVVIGPKDRVDRVVHRKIEATVPVRQRYSSFLFSEFVLKPEKKGNGQTYCILPETYTFVFEKQSVFLNTYIC